MNYSSEHGNEMGVSALIERLKAFDEQRHDLPQEIYHALNDVVLNAYQKMVYASRDLIGRVDDTKHTPEHIRHLIQLCPEALTQKDNYGNGILPIQRAALHSLTDTYLDKENVQWCRHHGISFIPMLAQEGVKWQVGGEAGRGGLLVSYDGSCSNPSDGNSMCLCYTDNSQSDFNVIQTLCVQYKGDDEICVMKCFQAIKSLISSGLLHKQDVIDYDLVYLSSWSFALDNGKRGKTNDSVDLFNFLVDWYPDALKIYHDGQLPIHSAAEYNEESFRHVLRAGMKHHPDELGFLFARSEEGETAIAQAMKTFTCNSLMNIIQNCIPPDEDHHPILHQVIRHEPEFIRHFTLRYPMATFKRDRNGRLPLHIALECGIEWSVDLVLMINSGSTALQKKKDPVTGLYLFMLAASKPRSNLTAIYHLLRSHPDVIEKRNSHSRRFAECLLD